MDENDRRVDPTTLDGIYDDLHSILARVEAARAAVEVLMAKLRDAD